MNRFFIASCALLACTVSLLAADPAPATQSSLNASTEVVFMQISRPIVQTTPIGKLIAQRRGQYGYNERNAGGIEMLITLTLPDHRIIAVPDDSLQVTSFIDDKNNDLGRGKRENRQNYNSGQQGISEDGHSCLISVSSDRAPGAGAERMLLRGTVSLRCGLNQKTSERVAMPVRVGKNLEAGPVPLGTQLKVMASIKDGAIVSIDPRQVLVSRFADDTGADLSTAVRNMQMGYRGIYPPYPYGIGEAVSKDGRQATFSIDMEAAPKTGATRVALDGSVGVRVGVGEKVTEVKDVELTVGRTLKVGDATLTIRTIQGSPNYGYEPALNDARIQIVFGSETSLELIRSIDFIDADGREVPAMIHRPPSQQFDGSPQQQNFTLTCSLSRDVERGTVRIKSFEKITPATIPFNIVTSIGI